MRSKDADRLGVIRMLISEIKNEAFSTQPKKRTPEEVVSAYLKKLNKAKDEFKDKEAFVKKLDFEIGVVSTFLPAMLTEDEIRAIIVNANLVEVSMRTVMPLLKGKSFDSKLVQKIISPI